MDVEGSYIWYFSPLPTPAIWNKGVSVKVLFLMPQSMLNILTFTKGMKV